MTECEHNRACRMAYGDEGCKPPCDLGLSCNLYEHKVDRDAMMALADDIGRHADMAAGHVAYAARFDFAGWARRIRDALGESAS